MYLSGRYTRWQSTIHWRNMSLKNRSTYLVDSCRYMTWLNRSWRVEELLVYKSLLAEKMLQSLLSWKYENIGKLTAIPAVYPLTTLHWPKPYFRSKISTRVFSLVSSGENDGLSSGLCTGSVWDKRIIIAIPETFTWWKGVTILRSPAAASSCWSACGAAPCAWSPCPPPAARPRCPPGLDPGPSKSFNDGSGRFHKHGEGPNMGLFLVESD